MVVPIGSKLYLIKLWPGLRVGIYPLQGESTVETPPLKQKEFIMEWFLVTLFQTICKSLDDKDRVLHKIFQTYIYADKTYLIEELITQHLPKHHLHHNPTKKGSL